MKVPLRSLTTSAAFLAAASFFSGAIARADDHVLPLSELRDTLTQSSAQRASDRAAIGQFFSDPRVRDTLKHAGLDADKVGRQASLLSDDEQARLAARVRAADRKISGGELKDAQVTLIIMAVAAFCFLSVLVLAFK